MSEYNQRQYLRMVGSINDFEAGKIGLDRLVNDLEGLLNALERVPESWKQAFLSEWGTLEDARAMIKFRASPLDNESMTFVRNAASRLKLMALDQVDDVIDR